MLDKDGALKSLMVDCCVKEQANDPGRFESVGNHLPRDVDFFPTHNIVSAVKMEPLKGGKWSCTYYKEVQSIFRSIREADRKQLYSKFVAEF